MWGRGLSALTLAFTLVGAAQAVTTNYPPANQPSTGPQAALDNLAMAYRRMSVAGVDAMLTNDYRFHSIGEKLASLQTYADGSPRDVEMASVRALLEGVTRDGKMIMPKADSVGMSFDGVSQGIDPEHADSTQHYRVLIVFRAQWGVRTTTGLRFLNAPSLHVFHVVRGDAAVLAPGQTPDSNRWYIRRWLEDVSGVRAAAGEKQGDCGERDPAAEPVASAVVPASMTTPGALGIRALTNPACSLLRVSCDLPGAEPAKVEVYDVSGRLVNTKQLAVKSAGNVSVDAGAGAHLIPGVYWVRLAQAKRPPSTRMVVVAR